MEPHGVPNFPFASLLNATAKFSDANRIGSGATGDVFRGCLSDDQVAIKRLKLPAVASVEARAHLRRRFLAELRTLAAFQHVRLVQLRGFAVDEAADARNPFALVFELLEGGSLADWLQGAAGEPPSRSVAVDGEASGRSSAPKGAKAVGRCCTLAAVTRTDIALGVAAGLRFLHGQEEPAADESAAAAAPAQVAAPAAARAPAVGGAGAAPSAAAVPASRVVLHRDIKAANIGLALLPGGGLHAKLLDFGLARAFRGEGAADGTPAPSASTTSLGAGTPGYMAPELGNTGPSVQTEVYALGIVLLELLMGQRADPRAVAALFEDAEDAGAGAAAAVVASKAQAGIWPAAAATALAELILACTQRRPRNRLPDVPSVASRLRAIRALLAPAAAATATCCACLEEVLAKDIVTCPPAVDVAAAAAAAAGGGSPAKAAAAAPAPAAPAAKGAAKKKGAGAASAPASAGKGDVAANASGSGRHGHLSSHGICTGCLQRHMATLEAVTIDMNGGCIPCPAPDCSSPGWALADVSDRIDKATVVAINTKLAKLADAARKKRAFDAATLEKVTRGLGLGLPAGSAGAGASAVPAAALAPAVVGGAGAAARAPAGPGPEPLGARANLLAEVICERDLTLRCPRCTLPFADISGCNAALCGSRDVVVAAGADVASYGCGARFCGVCCREFPTAAANHQHHKTAHGDYMDKALLQRAQAGLRASAAVASIHSFAKGAGGAALQRAVAEAVGDAVVSNVGLSVASLLSRAGVTTTGGSTSAAPGAAGATRAAEDASGVGADSGDGGDATAAAANRALAAAVAAAGADTRAAAVVAWLRDNRDMASNVTELIMPRSGLYSSGIAVIAGCLTYLPNLRTLDLSGNSITEPSASALAQGLVKLAHLQALNLASCFNHPVDRDGDGFSAVVSGLSHLPQLRRLILSENRLRDKHFKPLEAAIAKMPLLEHLALVNSAIDPGPAAALSGALCAALAHAPLLRVLDVSKNAFGAGGGATLAAGLAHVPQLRVLSLQECKLGIAGLSAIIAAFKSLPHLEMLDVSDNNFGAAGGAALGAGLASTPQLLELSLRSNSLEPGGTGPFTVGLIHTPKLRKLDFMYCTRFVDEHKLVKAAVPASCAVLC